MKVALLTAVCRLWAASQDSGFRDGARRGEGRDEQLRPRTDTYRAADDDGQTATVVGRCRVAGMKTAAAGEPVARFAISTIVVVFEADCLRLSFRSGWGSTGNNVLDLGLSHVLIIACRVGGGGLWVVMSGLCLV